MASPELSEHLESAANPSRSLGRPSAARRPVLRFVICFLLFNWIQGFAAEPQNILILGDSIGAGYGVDPSESFAGLLGARLKAEKLGYRIVNASVSGDTTASGLRRISWVLKRKAAVLLVELGGNDGLRGITPETTRANLEGIIDRARKKDPGIKIILAGMQMPGNMGKTFSDKYRAIYPAVAKAKDVALIPFLLEGVGAVPEMNQPDLIHPNPRGHRRVVENVWPILAKVMAK
jgi:acyl-CoA thioesterase I